MGCLQSWVCAKEFADSVSQYRSFRIIQCTSAGISLRSLPLSVIFPKAVHFSLQLLEMLSRTAHFSHANDYRNDNFPSLKQIACTLTERHHGIL